MTTTLAVVPDMEDEQMFSDDVDDDMPGFVEKTVDEKPPSQAIPFFEGQMVDFTKASFTSGTNLEIDDMVFRTDEIVQFVVEARCAGINHKVNEKSGALERIHTMKVIDVLPVPFDISIEQLREKAKQE